MEFCQHQSICGGCQYTHLPYALELEKKRDFFQKILNGLGFHGQSHGIHLDGLGHRVRTDFTLIHGKTGFFEKNSRKTFELVQCSHWTDELKVAFENFKRIYWPFQKASFRLRVNSKKEKGLWIDISNLDVKALLENRPLIEDLLQNFSRVEVGQRFKTLSITDRPRILETPPETWFETKFQTNRIPLRTFIGGFTQPSLAYNQKIIEQINLWTSQLNIQHTLELGAGIGNLSFPLMTNSKNLTAFESSGTALESFGKTLEDLPEDLRSEFNTRLKVVQGDFQNATSAPSEILGTHYDLIFCNPPRSGLMGFSSIIQKLRSSYLMYMSCYPESMEKDLQNLKANYAIVDAALIDQFPRSKHFESLILLQRI